MLTGQDGAVYFSPPGTEHCLLDFTDFPAGNDITVPNTHDFWVDDPIVFTEEGGANLDSALTAGATYYVVAKTSTTIQVSATKNGAPVTLLGDGGTGAEDTAGAENHINVSYDTPEAVCQVQSWSMDMTRAKIETTSLPCGINPNTGTKFAPFRTYQPGYADSSGTMTVRFARGAASMARRLLSSGLLRSQAGAEVELYLELVPTQDNTAPDLAKSNVIKGPISIEGFSTGATVEDTPIEASVNFSLSGQPTQLFGVVL